MRRQSNWRSSASLLHDDRGVSAAELMISVSLMVIVLAAAWTFAGAMQKGQSVSDTESALSDSIGVPLARMQEIVLQNNAIAILPAPDHYSLSVMTDQNLDDVLELHTFRVTTSTETVYPKNSIIEVAHTMNANGIGTNGAPFINGVIGRDNANRTSGRYLFRYYDSEHKEIAPDEAHKADLGLVPANTKFVVISIYSTYGGRTVTDSSTVQFRNRD